MLPVTCLPYDDRVEMPEALVAEILEPDHPVLAGLGGDWPPLLGVNEVEARSPDAEVARPPAGRPGRPSAARPGRHGKGRTAAWTADIGPHWLSPAFCAWDGYGRLWKNLLGWLTEAR